MMQNEILFGIIRKSVTKITKQKIMQKILSYLKKQSKWFWITVFVTIVIDSLNSAYIEKIQGFFYKILEGKDTKSIFSLLGIYLFFIVLLIFIGMMSSYEKQSYHSKSKRFIKKVSEYLTGIMIIGYGIILLMPSINILGMGSDTANFSSNTQMTYFMILIVLFITMIIFAFVNFKTRYVFGKSNYFYVYVPILIFITLFVDFSTALWKYQLFDPEHIADPHRASRILEFFILLPLYALFYAAPRFVLVRKSFNVFTFLSALFSTAYFVWKGLEFIEL